MPPPQTALEKLEQASDYATTRGSPTRSSISCVEFAGGLRQEPESKVDECKCQQLVACCSQYKSTKVSLNRGQEGSKRPLYHQKTTTTTTKTSTTSQVNPSFSPAQSSMSTSSDSLSSVNYPISVCGANRSSSLSVDSNNRPTQTTDTQTTTNNSRLREICSSQSTCSSCNNSLLFSYYSGSCCSGEHLNIETESGSSETGTETESDSSWPPDGEEEEGEEDDDDEDEEEEEEDIKYEEERRIGRGRTGRRKGWKSEKINRPITDIDIKCDNSNLRPTCSIVDIIEDDDKSSCNTRSDSRNKWNNNRKSEKKNYNDTKFTFCSSNCPQTTIVSEERGKIGEKSGKKKCHYLDETIPHKTTTSHYSADALKQQMLLKRQRQRQLQRTNDISTTTCNSELKLPTASATFFHSSPLSSSNECLEKQEINKRQRSHSLGYNSINKSNYYYNVNSNATSANKIGLFRAVIPKFAYTSQLQLKKRQRRERRRRKLRYKSERFDCEVKEEATTRGRRRRRESAANSAEITLQQQQCAFKELSFKCPNCQIKFNSSEVIVDVPKAAATATTTATASSLPNTHLPFPNNEDKTSSVERGANKIGTTTAAPPMLAANSNDKCKSDKLFDDQYSESEEVDEDIGKLSVEEAERKKWSQRGKRGTFESLFKSAFDSITNVGANINKAPPFPPTTLVHKNKSKSNIDKQATPVQIECAGLINQPPVRIEEAEEGRLLANKQVIVEREKGKEKEEEKNIERNSSQLESTATTSTMVVISTSANDNHLAGHSSRIKENYTSKQQLSNLQQIAIDREQNQHQQRQPRRISKFIPTKTGDESLINNDKSMTSNLLNPMDIVVCGRPSSNENRALSCTETSIPSLLVAQLTSNRSKSLCTNSQFEQLMKINNQSNNNKNNNNNQNSNNSAGIRLSVKNFKKPFAQNLSRKVNNFTRRAISRIRGLSISNPNLLVSECDSVKQSSEDGEDVNDNSSKYRDELDRTRLRANSANIDYNHAINIKRRASSQRAKCDKDDEMSPHIIPHQLNRFMSVSSGANLEKILDHETTMEPSIVLESRQKMQQRQQQQQQVALMANDNDFDDQLFYSADGIYIGPGGICSWRDICAANKATAATSRKTSGAKNLARLGFEKKRHKSMMVPLDSSQTNINTCSSQGGATSWLSRPFRLSVAQALLGGGQTTNNNSNNHNISNSSNSNQQPTSLDTSLASAAASTAAALTTISWIGSMSNPQQPLATKSDLNVFSTTTTTATTTSSQFNNTQFTSNQQQRQQEYQFKHQRPPLPDVVIRVGCESAQDSFDSTTDYKYNYHNQQQNSSDTVDRGLAYSSRQHLQTRSQEPPSASLGQENEDSRKVKTSLSNTIPSTVSSGDCFWISNEEHSEDKRIESEEKSVLDNRHQQPQQQQQQQHQYRQESNNDKNVVRNNLSNKSNSSWISNLTHRVHHQTSSSPTSRTSPHAPKLQKTQSNFRDSCGSSSRQSRPIRCNQQAGYQSSLDVESYSKSTPTRLKPSLAKENRSTSLNSLHINKKRRQNLCKSSMDLNYNQIVERNNIYLNELNSRYSASTHELAAPSNQAIKSLDNDSWFRRSFMNSMQTNQSENIKTNSNNLFSINQIVSEQQNLVLDQIDSNTLLRNNNNNNNNNTSNTGLTGGSYSGSATNLKASMSERTKQTNSNSNNNNNNKEKQQQQELYGANLQTICVHCQLIAELASYPSSSYLSQLLSSSPSTTVSQQQQQTQQYESQVAKSAQNEIPIQLVGPKPNNVVDITNSSDFAKTKPSVVLTICSSSAPIDYEHANEEGEEDEDSYNVSFKSVRGTRSSTVSVEKAPKQTEIEAKSSSLRSSLKSRSGYKLRKRESKGNKCRYSSSASLVSKSSCEVDEKSSISEFGGGKFTRKPPRRSSAESRGKSKQAELELDDENANEDGDEDDIDGHDEDEEEEEAEADTLSDDSAEHDEKSDKLEDDDDDNHDSVVQADGNRSEKGADAASQAYFQELPSKISNESYSDLKSKSKSKSRFKLEAKSSSSSKSKSKSKSKLEAELKTETSQNISSTSSSPSSCSTSSPTTSSSSSSKTSASSGSSSKCSSSKSTTSSDHSDSDLDSPDRAFAFSDNNSRFRRKKSSDDLAGSELLLKQTVSADGSSLELLLINSNESHSNFTAVDNSFRSAGENVDSISKKNEGSGENVGNEDDNRSEGCQTRRFKMSGKNVDMIKVGRNKGEKEGEDLLRIEGKQKEKVKNTKSPAKSTKGKEKQKQKENKKEKEKEKGRGRIFERVEKEDNRYEDEVEVEGKKKKNECKGFENRGSRIKKDEIETMKCEGEAGISKESSSSIKVNSRKNNNLKKNKKRNKKMKKKTRKDKKDEDDEFGLEFEIEAGNETEIEVGGEEVGVEVENYDLEAYEEEEEDEDRDRDEIEDEQEEEDEDTEDVCSGGGGGGGGGGGCVVVVVDSESRSTLPTKSKAITSAEGNDSVKETAVCTKSTKTPPPQPTATTLSVTTNTLEVPANKQARSASLDAPYLLKVPTADELADFYDESYPSSKANRSRSVDISLPTKPGEYYTVCQLISSSGAQGGVSSENERNQARVTDLAAANESQKKFIQGEIKVACANGETRALKLFVDWRENCVNGEHLWIYVGSSSEACYVGENECLKHGPRLCCSACKITAHTSCISILIDKIKFICKHTFKDLTINNPRHLKELQQQNVIYHHWVHKRTHCGRCKHCTKTFGNTKLPFSSKEIQAITCSWCKVSYHNKENCYTLSALTEPCTLGAHRESIIPPPWILKIPAPATNNLPQPQQITNFSSNDENQNIKDINNHLHSNNLIDLSMTTSPNALNKSHSSDNSNKENSEINLIDQRQHHINITNRNITSNNNNQQTQTFGSNTTLMTDTSGYMSADGTNVQPIFNKVTNNSVKMLCENQYDRNKESQNIDAPEASEEIIMDPSALQVTDLSLINQTSQNQQQVKGRHPQEAMSQYHKHQLKQYYKQIDANQNSEQPFKMVGDHDNEDPTTLNQLQAMQLQQQQQQQQQQQNNRLSVSNMYQHFKIVPQPIQGIPNAGSKPVLVFVNPRSGGNQGAKMMQKFNWLLNPRQVFDLIQSDGPRAALELYSEVPNLRILTIGGDGTASWILSELDEVGIANRIPVAVLPLGTGNDLARALGWGGGYTDEPIAKILTQVRDGEVVQLDRWNLQVERNFEATPSSPSEFSSTSNLGVYPASTSMETSSPVISSPSYAYGSLTQCNTNTASTVSIIDHTNCDTNMIQVPSAHQLSSGFNIVGDESGSDRLPMDVINNYFSFGVDAHIALEFHTAREAHPERFNSRLRNKMFYGQAGGKDLLKRKWKDLSNFVTLYCDGQDMTSRLKELKVHSVLFLNIPSYGGGTRPWPTTATSFAKPRTDDGLIEVIGLTTYQLPLLQAGGHGTCIAQCRNAKIITSRTIPMQVDGEPCKLLPSHITISFKNRVCMLAKSKSSNKNTNVTSGNIQKTN